MDADLLLGTAQRLNVAVEALAALGARTRAGLADLELDPDVAERLDAVVAATGLDPDELDRLPEPVRHAALGAIGAFFAQAAALLADPATPPGWAVEDAAVIESQGRASAMLAPLVDGFAGSLGDLADRLSRPGARFLDVGTGVGHLSIAMARQFPELSIVGIDRWAFALDRARANVGAAGLDDRIQLRDQDVADLDDDATFDLAFLPGPFLSGELVPDALRATKGALAPGGWALFGRYAGPPDELAQACTDLRVVRSGGHPWTTAAIVAALEQAGFTEVHEIERTWAAPMGFVAGHA
jgi:SAM-dependent methyltransferase